MISLDLSEACGKKNATNAGLHPAPAANHNRNITSVMAKITTTRAGKEGKDIKVRIEDLRGLRFGRLVCAEPFYKEKPDRGWHWKFVCDCGKASSASSRNIQSGHTESCGCFMRDQLAASTSSHGRSKHSAYMAWAAMMARCYNEKCKHFKNYGGRGISVCAELLIPEMFCKEMGEKPFKKATIDRINNDEGYFCGKCAECKAAGRSKNVRWADTKIQSRNKRNSRILSFAGKNMIPADWAKKLGISMGTIVSRIRLGWSVSEALSTPISFRTKKNVELHN